MADDQPDGSQEKVTGTRRSGSNILRVRKDRLEPRNQMVAFSEKCRKKNMPGEGQTLLRQSLDDGSVVQLGHQSK